MNKETPTKTFSSLLTEGFANPAEFKKVLPAATEQDHSQVMFKLLQTLSNFHDSIADLYAKDGNNGKASYHYQMANRIRTEAQQSKRASS